MQDIDLLAIERECARLVAQYCQLIDHGRAGRVCDLFTEDAVWASPETTLSGREEIARSFQRREQNAGRRSRHVCSTMLLDVLGPDEATGVTYLTLYRDDGPVGRGVSRIGGPAVVGEYRDRFVRTDAGWRIQRRELVVAFVGATS